MPTHEERVLFTEENCPGHHVRLVISGKLDSTLLDALDSYIERARGRIDNDDNWEWAE